MGGDKDPQWKLKFRCPDTMWGKKREVIVSSTILWEDLIVILDVLFGLKEEGKRVQALNRLGFLMNNDTHWKNFVNDYVFDDEVLMLGVKVEPIPEEEEATMPPPPEEAAGDTVDHSQYYNVEDILYVYSSEEVEEEEEYEEVKWVIPEDVCTNFRKERDPIEDKPSTKEEEVCDRETPQYVYLWKSLEYEQQIDLELQINTLTMRLDRTERKLNRCVEELVYMKSKTKPKSKSKKTSKQENVRSVTRSVYDDMIGRKFNTNPDWYTKEWIRSSAKRYLQKKYRGRVPLPSGYVDQVIEYGMKEGYFVRKYCRGTYMYQKAERY